MAITNDWQILTDIQYNTFSDVSEARSGNYMLNAESAAAIASAMGWEVVELSDYMSEITIGSYTYDTSNIRLIRPVAGSEETDYNTGCMFLGRLYYSSGAYYTNLTIELSTGTIIGKLIYSEMPLSHNVYLLRPMAKGAMALKGSTSTIIYFDIFHNPKTEAEKWGTFDTEKLYFTDLYTGLWFQENANAHSCTKKTFSFGHFVSLIKLTTITATGIFQAKTMYRYILGYGIYEKTIELDGIKYVNVGGSYIYIPLED